MELFVINTSELILLESFLEEKIEFESNFSLDDAKENYLIYLINNKVAALAFITYEKTIASTYQYKVDIRHITEPKSRTSIPPFAKFNNGKSINSKQEIQKILEVIQNIEFSFSFYSNNAEELLLKEKKKIDKQKLKVTRKVEFVPTQDMTYKNISEPHLKAQYMLREIADSIGYDTHIAKNDQNKIYNNELLSDGYLETIPYDKISKDTKQIISLVDVIWFDNNVAKAAFEIELSTSISSGLLRISDIVLSINPNTDFYIITTKAREKKLRKELNRPIFTTTGISQRCKVIFLDELEILYQLVKPLNGYIKGNILNRITHNFSAFDSSNSNENRQIC